MATPLTFLAPVNDNQTLGTVENPWPKIIGRKLADINGNEADLSDVIEVANGGGSGGLPEGGAAGDILSRNAQNLAAWETSAGLMARFQPATPDRLGPIKPDGVTLVTDPVTGVTTAMGGGGGGNVAIANHDTAINKNLGIQHYTSSVGEGNLSQAQINTGFRDVIAGKADKTYVDTGLAAKADQTDLLALANTVAAKADASDLATKADQSDVALLANVVATKADQSDLAALGVTVAGKQAQVTYGTSDLTAGTSALATGSMYLVYE